MFSLGFDSRFVERNVGFGGREKVRLWVQKLVDASIPGGSFRNSMGACDLHLMSDTLSYSVLISGSPSNLSALTPLRLYASTSDPLPDSQPIKTTQYPINRPTYPNTN